MSRPFHAPAYRIHKSTGLAVVTIRLPGGSRRDVYLGKHNTDESRREYAKLVAELATVATVEQVVGCAKELTVDEVLLAFWHHADRHYRRADGTTTHELVEYRQVFKVVRLLYGSARAVEFGPIGLKAVRHKMIDLGLSRTTINNRIRRLKHVFKWAVAEELVPPSIHQALIAVAGLQRGRSQAPEPDPVQPVAPEHVLTTLIRLPHQVRGMVEIELLTGMRPAEVCAIRPIDINKLGDVWTYRPTQHKTAWRGKPRVIAIGPRAQTVLKEFEPANPTEFYFSPRRTVTALHADRGETRVTPRYPSHMLHNAARRALSPKRPAGSAYSSHSYAQAITRSVDRLNAAFIESAVELEQHVPRWSPNQLRHLHATEVRRRFGLEAAQVALGYERADVTQVYAERNQELAAKVAAAMG